MVRRTRVRGCVHHRPVRSRPLGRVQKTSRYRVGSCRAASAFARLAAAVCVLFALTGAHAEEGSCPNEIAAFAPNGAAPAFPKVRVGLPNDILAIGSSSTEGIGARSPAHTYPAPLEAELEKRAGAASHQKNRG